MKKIILLLLVCATLTYSCNKDAEIYPATNSSLAKISSFRLVTETGQNAAANVTIDAEKGTITVKANTGISLGRLFPSATVSEGAIVEPALGTYTDFSKPVVYTVIAGNRQDKKTWTVKVN
ncbi:hypothetical protein AQ505_09500 [Pedobacter sp. PACM 27299]|uniref:DUF5018-related domain-containing protein n=1 Tax=Pedobacter sp. PACM 27299 TaxID=1727164 RepID=UPI0007068DAD|nr:hypothetical protein [Pedobacter sp. PACM 27299]ALL05705.1 hypothetical protein AQ505_09500 [Pedobacter sp. PACM 27299]